MCGICGIYQLESPTVNAEEFGIFVDSLQHRGPDGKGVFKDKREEIYLGHTRLKILDLSSAGYQPMCDPKKRYWITFNGEIYNFLELRDELVALGYTFTTDTDTEVILASYDCWKDKCQLKFNGMWAFAICDAQEKKLFLSRDRFAVKPLYYFWDGHHFAFASEMKAFLALPFIDCSFDEEAVTLELMKPWSLEATERCLMKNIKRLQPGHAIHFSREDGLKVERWWHTLEHLMEVPKTWDEQVQKFLDLLIDACKIRMRSDVPLGCAVSGGLDSSSVLSLMALIKEGKRLPPDWNNGFIARYENSRHDEYDFAHQVVVNAKAKEHCLVLRHSDLLAHFDEALLAVSEIIDPPVGPFLLYKEFRKAGKYISLDGHGGDELLGGYNHYYEAAIVDAFSRKKNLSQFFRMRNLLQEMAPWRNTKKEFTLTRLVKNLIKQKNPDSLEEKLQHPFLYREIVRLKEKPFDCFSNDPLNAMLYQDFHDRMLPTILRNFDRCSMANGVEVRAPLLDWRLVCYSFSLPTHAKINYNGSKYILREAMKGILPEPVRIRKSKIGFANPLLDWFHPEMQTFIFDNLSSSTFLNSSIWKGEKIRDYALACFKKGDKNGVYSCWSFLLADRLMQLLKSKKRDLCLV